MTSLTESDLLNRWDDAVRTAGACADGALREMAGRALLECWNEPHRRYHDVEHLGEVLLALDALDCDSAAARLAAWFHDAIYLGEPGPDEAHSAELAARALAELGVPDSTVQAVVGLVLMTVHHDPDSPEGAALSDADLAILAADPDRYQSYRTAVRDEYAAVDDRQFALGRAKVLRELLARPRLYLTRRGHALWEDSARANVAAELDSWLAAEDRSH